MNTEREAREHLSDLIQLARAMLGPTDARAVRGVCDRAVERARALGDRDAEFDGLYYLGVGHSRVGEFAEARDAYAQAMALARERGDADAEQRARQGLLNALDLLGEHEAALAEAEIVASSEDVMLRCTGLVSIAAIRHALAEYEACLARLREAEELLAAASCDRRDHAYVQAYIAGNRTNVFLDMGRLEDACLEADRMASAASLAGDAPQAVEALINSGLARTRMGDLAAGWQALNQAAQASALAEDPLRQATTEWALAEWNTAAGLMGPAAASARAALARARDLRARYVELQANLALGAALLESGEPAEAEEPIREAAEVADALRAPYCQVAAQLLSGRLAVERGEADSAEPLLAGLVSRSMDLSMDGLAVEAGLHLARARLLRGDRDHALASALQATAAAQRHGARNLLWRANHSAGQALEALGRVPEALACYRDAMETIETMWWPLWRLGFAEVDEVSPAVLAVYLAYLRAATGAGRRQEVSRVLAVSPWPFLRAKWVEAGGEPGAPHGFGPPPGVPPLASAEV